MIRFNTLFGTVVAAGLLLSPVSMAQTSDQLTGKLKTAAEGVIDGQISAFRAKDHEKAFSFAAPSIRNMFGNTDRFIGMVKNGYGAIYGARNWSFGRGQSAGGMLVQEVLLVGPQGKNWVALYTLRQQEDGSWRIGGVQLKPASAQST